MSLNASLSIARQGLAVSQLGLQVTAQNIANVNTDGYRRQNLIQSNLPYGLGVTMQSIDRVLHPLGESQLLNQTSIASASTTMATAYSEIESLFNEVNNRGLDAEFQDFFKASQDLSASPGGQSERATLRSRGESIGSVFSFLNQQLKSQMQLQDQDLGQQVQTANGLIRKIANLNQAIGGAQGNEIGTNELLNDRDTAVRDLAKIVPVAVSQNEQGAYQLYIQSGMPLVVGTDYYQLEARPDPANNLQRDIYWVNQQGTQMDITKQFQEGTLGAALQLRDHAIPEQLAKLDRVAAEFVMAFNAQHRAGTGLDGVSGRDFFNQLPAYTHAGKDNLGGATVTASSIVNPAATTFDNYEIRFTAPGAYDVVNTTTGATVVAGGAYTSGTAIAFDGLSVTIGDTTSAPQTGDTFAVSIVTDAAAKVGISAALAASTDVIAAGQSASSGDNRNALALAGLQTRTVALGGTASLRQLYQNMLVELGVKTDAANQQDKSQSTVLTQTSNLIESVSGVNTDEEATRLIAYQRAFQASSKVIQVTDTLMDSLIQMIR